MIHTPAIIVPLELRGFVEGWHFIAKKGLWVKKFAKANSIQNPLRVVIRDNLYANSDFAMDNLFDTDGQEYGGTGYAAGDPDGKDGVVIYDYTGSQYLTMVTAVHPTDPSGDYYKQWRGVLTNDFGVGSIVIGGTSYMGFDLIAASGAGSFAVIYAKTVIDEQTTMLANDILTVDWKITIGEGA